jgi:transposase
LDQLKIGKTKGVFYLKLSLEDKLNIIKNYESGESQESIRRKYKVSRTILKILVKQYKIYGIDYFKKKGENKKHTPEFKKEIIERVKKGESKGAIAIEVGINAGLIHAWCKKYDELGYNGLKQDLRGHHMKKKQTAILITEDMSAEEKIKALEKQNEQLRMENDLLKKLRALVQQRNKPQDKKK